MDYPIKQPLDSRTLARYSFHLYRKSFFSVLPFMAILVLMYHFIVLGHTLFPQDQAMMQLNIAMFMLVMMFPIAGCMFYWVDQIAQGHAIGLQQVLTQGFARILSLFGCLINIILFPLIIFGLCFGIYFLMGRYELPIWATFIFLQLIPVFIFASVVSKIFSFVLVYTKNLDANVAVEESARLVKGFYFRTLIWNLLSLFLIILIGLLPHLIEAYMPDMKSLSIHLKQSISDVLFILIAPWTVACLIVQLEDLQLRRTVA